MCHQHERRARRAVSDVLLQPFELLVAELGETGGFKAELKIEHVEQADKMDARRVEAVPAFALRIFAVAFEVGLAVVGVSHIMLAGNVEHLLGASAPSGAGPSGS